MKILFICKSNVGRSQIAEAFFNIFSKKDKAISTGTQVFEKDGQVIEKNGKTKFLFEVMNEEGIDLSKKKQKQLTPKMIEEADKIIVMAERFQCPDYLLNNKKVSFWKVDDINGQYDSYEFHIKTRNKIRELVKRLVKQVE
jgi:protein-tyrosine-phosphatase